MPPPAEPKRLHTECLRARALIADLAERLSPAEARASERLPDTPLLVAIRSLQG